MVATAELPGGGDLALRLWRALTGAGGGGIYADESIGVLLLVRPSL